MTTATKNTTINRFSPADLIMIAGLVITAGFLKFLNPPRDFAELEEESSDNKFIPNNQKSNIGWQAFKISNVSDERLIAGAKETPGPILSACLNILGKFLKAPAPGIYYKTEEEGKVWSKYGDAKAEGERKWGRNNFEIKSVAK